MWMGQDVHCQHYRLIQRFDKRKIVSINGEFAVVEGRESGSVFGNLSIRDLAPLERCIVQRYDPACKEAPFEMLRLRECEIGNRKLNDGGRQFAEDACDFCRSLGYRLMFRSSERGYDHAFVVA